MRFLISAAAIAAILPGTAYAQVMSQADINDAIRQQKASTPASSDPFSAPAVSSLAGRAFRLEFPIKMEGAEGGSPLFSWTYNREARELAFRVLPSDFQISTAFMEGNDFLIPVSNDVSGFATDEARAAEGVETMSNAYGASVEVETFRERTFGVAEVSPDYRTRLPGGEQSFYRHRITIEPEAARALVGDLRWVVTGVVRDWKPGRAVLCGSNYQEPSFRNPTQVLGETCLLTVEFSSFAIVDGATGETIREWRDR